MTITMLAMFIAATLSPAAGPTGPTRAALTIYNHDLAFARESRSLRLETGHDTVRLGALPDRLDVSSVRLGLEGGGRVSRLAYRYDVASGDRMLEISRGRRISVRIKDRVVEGTLVSADGSWLMIREDSGAIETVSRAAIEDVRLPDPPDHLATEPTLEVQVDGGHGTVQATLSYLTGGLSWSAEHTIVRTGETGGLWSSMISIENTSGRDYEVPRLGLVAGEPRQGARPPMPMMEQAMKMSMARDAAGAPEVAEQSFADYHLYTLERPALLRDRETQRLPLLDERSVRLTPRYVARPGIDGVTSQLELTNTKAGGLGLPIPAGRVRVYERDDRGELRFTGESAIGHTAESETLRIDVGRAFDLVAERRQVSDRRISDREHEYEMEVRFRNHKKSAVTILAEETVAADHEVLKSSHSYRRKDASTLVFSVPVPPGKEVVLDYVVRARW